MADVDEAIRVLKGDVGEGAHEKARPLRLEEMIGGGEHDWFVSSAGVQYTTEMDQMTGEMVVRGYQDVYAILEANQAMFNENKGYTPDKSMQRCASVPLILRNKIMIEEGWDPYRPDLYPERFKRLMNDIDYRKLRTGGGRV